MASQGPLLALDLSTRSGWAFHPGGIQQLSARMLFGTWDLDGSMGDPEPCWASLVDVVNDAWRVHKFERVAVEAPLPATSQTRQQFAVLAMGLASMVRVFCWRRSIQCDLFNASTVRKAILGHGFPKKPEIVGWCRARGYDVVDDNAADALVLAHYVVAPSGRAWPPQMKPTMRAA
jgi:Holliday junction resolvasome RuvABC endonuclease subunit